jgi:hypothetical protein
MRALYNCALFCFLALASVSAHCDSNSSRQPRSLGQMNLALGPGFGKVRQLGNWTIGSTQSLSNRSQTMTTIGILSDDQQAGLLITCYGDNRLGVSVDFGVELEHDGDTTSVMYRFDKNSIGVKESWDILVGENKDSVTSIGYPDNYSTDDLGRLGYSTVILFVRSLISANAFTIHAGSRGSGVLTESFKLGANKQALQKVLYACGS